VTALFLLFCAETGIAFHNSLCYYFNDSDESTITGDGDSIVKDGGLTAEKAKRKRSCGRSSMENAAPGRKAAGKEAHMRFDDIIDKVNQCSMKKMAVAAAQDEAVLRAVWEAKKKGIADAILVGDEAKIREIAAEMNMDLSDYQIIDEPDMSQAALKAVKLAHDGVVDMYMKGLIDTKSFLKSVLDKEVGLRTGKPLSHV